MEKRASFTIPTAAQFDFRECLWFLNRDFDDCMHRIEGDSVVKALLINGNPSLFRVSGSPGFLHIAILSGGGSQERIQAVRDFVTDWLDPERDMLPFYALLRKEKKLAYMAETFAGLHLVGLPDLFEALCWGMIGQQINLNFAYRMKRRLVERYGTFVTHNDQRYYLFPEPSVLAGADIAELREMQYSQKKAEYVTGLARCFDEGQMSRSILEGLPAFAARQQALTAIRGVGIWTANYALMKSLRMPEAVPYGDAGLLQALVRHGLLQNRKDQAGLDILFRKFRGWEIYLVLYLWRSLSAPAAV